MHHLSLLGLLVLLLSCVCVVPLAFSPGSAPRDLHDVEAMITPIHRVQGHGPGSPLEGQRISVRGVVTARSEIGVYLQSLEGQADEDEGTSEGVFVYLGVQAPPGIRVGTQLRVDGIVSEDAVGDDATQTWITRARLHVERSRVPLPAPIVLHQEHVARTQDVSHLDGMRVHLVSLNDCTCADGATGTEWLAGTPLGARCTGSRIPGATVTRACPLSLNIRSRGPQPECLHATPVSAPR